MPANKKEHTNLHALVCRQQLHTQLVRRKHLSTLIPNDLAYRTLRAKVLLAVHDVHPQARQHAMQRLREKRVSFWLLAWTPRRGRGRARLACNHDLSRERDHLLHEVFRREMPPQHLVRSPGGVRALDEHDREVMRDLGRRRPPNGHVPRFDSDAVRLDVPEKDEFVLGGEVFDEEARTLVGTEIILAMTDRHTAYPDVREYRLVFSVGVKADVG